MVNHLSMQSILWRRLDQPGHDWARLSRDDMHWSLVGAALFADDGRPCRLDYQVICNAEWRTLSGVVTGWLGNAPVRVALSVGEGHRWWINGVECPAVAGCLDLDLSFTPATNLLPIRRLALSIGEEAAVQAAWLCFPSLTLEPLDQRYRRIEAKTYRYASSAGSFTADLHVNADGFIVAYPGLWQVEGE